MSNYRTSMAALCVLLLAGCAEQGGHTSPPELLKAGDYGDLPALKKTRNARLRDELHRVIEQKGTPEELSRTTVAASDNAAVVLIDLFPQAKIESMLKAARGILPPAKQKYEYDDVRLQRAIDFRKRHDSQRLKAREAVALPQCDFGIQFKAGHLAELEFIDVVSISVYLEAFQAAESLADGDTGAAIEALEQMLGLVLKLGAEKHLVARLEAAYLRTNAYCVLQSIVRDRNTTHKHLVRMYRLVREQLKKWPADADAWIGERAMGMHAYEMVRTGDVATLFGPEDFQDPETEGTPDELIAAAQRSVESDELYYLQTMQRVIDSCREPYYRRSEVLDGMENDLQARRNGSDYPLIAGRLLLRDVRRAQQIQAEDRANWAAWAVALAAATAQPPPPYKINPLSGEPYSVTKFDDEVEVGNIGTGQQDHDPLIHVRILQGAN